jgi:apoptosis-inducing factor 2
MSNNYSYRKCYENAEFYELFSAFLKSSLNLELLHFYELVNDFNLLMNESYKEKRAEAIVDTFLKSDSPEQINISVGALEETLSRYQKAKDGEILFDDEIFEPCLKIVSHDLRHDAFYRFKMEKCFLSFMEDQKKVLGLQKFRETFLKDVESSENTEGENDSDNSDDHKRMDPALLLTVKINFDPEELKVVFSERPEKIHNYLMNKMVVDMMKPFVGVQTSTPDEVSKEKPHNFASLLKTITLTKKKNTLDENSIVRRFQRQDALQWIQKYLKFSDEEASEAIFKMLESYNIIESVREIEGFDTTDYFNFKLKKKVIVIGCGAGGITAANILKEHMEVIVIDSKSVMSFVNGYYNLFSNPMLIENYEFPAESMVKGCKYIQAKVKKISPSVVYLDKEIIAYDYLIIASGSHYYVPYEISFNNFTPKFPGYKFNDSKDQIFNPSEIRIVIPYKKKSIISSYPFIREAKRAIIIGSGPVACETAGELAVKYPKLEIVIITQYKRLLQKYHSKKVSNTTMNILENYGNIKFHFRKVITRVEGKNVYFKNLTENIEVKNAEESMEGDILINCMGLRPNTEMFNAYMSDSLNAKGFVQVNDYFQVLYGKFVSETQQNLEEFLKNTLDSDENSDGETDDLSIGSNDSFTQILEKMNNQTRSIDTNSENVETVVVGYNNIYAIGDIIQMNEEKLTFFAELHGSRASENILNMERSNSPEEFKSSVMRYKGGSSIIQCVSLGEKAILFKGKKYISHGCITKFKSDFIGKQLENIVNLDKSTE